MNASQIDLSAENAAALAAGSAATIDQAKLIRALSRCSVLRIAKSTLDELAKFAPITYAWAIRWVSGKLGNHIRERCGG